MMSEKFYTVAELAKRLRVCQDTIRRAIRDKRINALRVRQGTKSPYRIPESEIERLAVMCFDERLD